MRRIIFVYSVASVCVCRLLSFFIVSSFSLQLLAIFLFQLSQMDPCDACITRISCWCGRPVRACSWPSTVEVLSTDLTEDCPVHHAIIIIPAGLRQLLSPRRPKYRLVHPIVYDRILSCRVATSLSRSLRFSAASSFIRTSCDPSPVAPVSVESLCVALSSTGPSPRCNLLCRSSLSAIFNLKACAPMSSGCTMLPARICCWALVQLVRGAVAINRCMQRRRFA